MQQVIGNLSHFHRIPAAIFIGGKEGQKNIQDKRKGEEIKEHSILGNLKDFRNMYILT